MSSTHGFTKLGSISGSANARQAFLDQGFSVKNTWYNLVSATGAGEVGTVGVEITPSSSRGEARIQVDGGTWQTLTAEPGSDSGRVFNEVTFKRNLSGIVKFTTSLAIQVRRSSGANTTEPLHAIAEYSIEE